MPLRVSCPCCVDVPRDQEKRLERQARLAKGEELVFVLAASNLPWCLDMAMLRRLEKRILVPLPGHQARKMMFEKLLSESKLSLTEGRGTEDKSSSTTIDFGLLADRTEGYSGADIHLVAKEAAMRPLRRLMGKLETLDDDQLNSEKLKDAMEPISISDIFAALECTKASTSANTKKYKKWQEEFGSSL